MSNGTNDNCFVCGKKGHFANNCDESNLEKENVENVEYVWCCEYCNKEFLDESKCENHEKYCNKKCSKKYYEDEDEDEDDDDDDDDDDDM